MQNRAISSTERWLALLGLAVVLLLPGCPGRQNIRSWQGSDHAKVARYTYAGLRIAQRYEPRPYAHVEVLFAKNDFESLELTRLLLQSVLLGGSADQPGPAFVAALERAGAVVDLQLRPTHVALRLRCLSSHLQDAFGILADALLHPVVPRDPFGQQCDALRRQLASRLQEPAELARLQLQAALYDDTAPPAFEWDRDEADYVQNHYLGTSLLIKCRMAVTTVGPVDAEQLGDCLFNTLDQLPEGECAPATYRAPAWGRIAATQVDGGQQHISGALPGPPAGHPDAVVLAATMDLLQAWMQQRLVIGQRLLTSAEARYLPGMAGQAGQVSLELGGPRPLQAAELLLSELRTLKAEGIRPGRLDSAKAWLAVDGGIGMESAAAIAEQMGTAIHTDAWPNFGNPEARIAALRPAHIQQVLNTYATQISWGFAGDTLRLDRKTLLRL
jgi:predicted Zn-dependent peptidase